MSSSLVAAGDGGVACHSVGKGTVGRVVHSPLSWTWSLCSFAKSVISDFLSDSGSISSISFEYII